MALIFVILTALAIEGLAFKFPSSVKESSEDSTITDLAALVRPSSIEDSAIYSDALHILTSMQASPSCHRLAASKLLNSCQSIEGAPSTTEPSLDDARSIYAAQLAMCEITSAGSAIPQQCRPLTPGHETRSQRGASPAASGGRQRPYSASGSEHLSQCLQALESRPQWWTSYSNSRQNAVVMCRASRMEIEKDDLIKLHMSMVKTSSDVDSALSKALEEANAQLLLQRDFAAAIDTFQKQLLKELETSGIQAQSFLQRLMETMDAAMQNLKKRLSVVTKEAETAVAGLGKNVQQSNAEAIELQKNIGKVFQHVAQESSALAALQTEQWDVSRGLAADLQSSLESMRGNEVHTLLGAFGAIHNQLQMSNELVSRMYHRQDELDQRLLNLDKSFTGLETKAQAFYTAQTLQAETQTRLHDQMQVEMHVTRGLLADVTSSAVSLQSAVDSTSAKIAQMAALGGLSAKFVQWSWLALVLLIVYQFNPKVARYAMATIGTFLLYSISGNLPPFSSVHEDTILVHYASGHQIRAQTLEKVVTFFGLLVALGIIYSLRAQLRKITIPRYVVSTDLPSLGMRAPGRRFRAWQF